VLDAAVSAVQIDRYSRMYNISF